jgi:hypothetical protein
MDVALQAPRDSHLGSDAAVGKVGQCQRQGVGGVIGCRRFWQLQHGANHVNNLIFAGAARTDHGGFDLFGAVFKHGNLELGAGEQDHADGFTNFEGGSWLQLKELRLDCQRVGSVNLEYAFDRLVNHGEALRTGTFSRGFDQFGVKVMRGDALLADHANAEVCQSWVYADNDQGFTLTLQDYQRVAKDGCGLAVFQTFALAITA